jgi:hypothetical protein
VIDWGVADERSTAADADDYDSTCRAPTGRLSSDQTLRGGRATESEETMKGFITRHRPSPTMAVALLALSLGLGGISYAAITLPKNSVGTKQLKKKAVTVKKIAANAVTSPKVKDGSLRGVDFAAGQLPAGPKGDQGAAGPPGPSDAFVSRTSTIQAFSATGPTQFASLSLPAGSYVFTAKLLADNDNGSATRVDCTLDGPGGEDLDFMKLRLAPTDPPNLEFGNISLASAATLSALGTVSVNCEALENIATNVTVGFRTLVAVKVGALHAQ